MTRWHFNQEYVIHQSYDLFTTLFLYIDISQYFIGLSVETMWNLMFYIISSYTMESFPILSNDVW